MKVQRCPECGIRLKTNYCDICMKRVPFTGVPAKQTFQHAEASSAHRMEKGHTCVSFERKEKKTFPMPANKQQTMDPRKLLRIVAIIFALITLVPTLFSIVQELTYSEPIPEPEPILVGDVPAIEPREVYNDGKVIVTADFAALYYDDYTVFMSVINESGEDLIVGTDLVSVNGFMHQTSLYAEVDAGETVQESLQIYSWETERDGIDEIAEIAFYLCIYPDDYSETTRSELITLTTDADYTEIPREVTDGWELYQDESVTVRLLSCAGNGDDLELKLYLENPSAETISVYTENIYVNEEKAQGFFWETLRSDTRSNREVYVYETGVDSLEQVESITFQLVIDHMDGYLITDSHTETVTVYPNP